MTLVDLGYTKEIEHIIQSGDFQGFEIGRVIKEHKERYIIKSEEGEFEAEITGNMRFTVSSKTDFPAVGDWVAFTPFDTNSAIIHKIVPRKTILERQAIGTHGEKQIISTNIDFALIVQAINNNFNINRLDRYLTICYSANIQPILILSKIDLINKDKINSILTQLESRKKKIITIPLSNKTKDGYDQIRSIIKKRKTYCIIGSSGVGKSSLINNLTNENMMNISEISESTNKGKHTTSHRELIILNNGGILIDTPGMRELGITEDTKGLETTFDVITNLTYQCKYNNCSHTNENDCAVIGAIKKGTISSEEHSNYLKMIREQEHFQSSLAEKRKKGKEFGKMCKTVIKNKKWNKF